MNPVCENEPVALPINIFVPIRGELDINFNDTVAKVIAGIALPADELVENLMITVLARSADGSVRVSWTVSAMIVNRQADTPNAYSVVEGHQAAMIDEDMDFELDLVPNGDTSVNLRLTDTSGDAGIMTVNFHVWTMAQLLLS